MRDFQGQPGFADADGAGEGEQARFALSHTGNELIDCLLPADQRSGWEKGQVRPSENGASGVVSQLGPCRCQKCCPVDFTQLETGSQHADSLKSGRCAQPTLEVTDGSRAEARALLQLFLAKTGAEAQMPDH